jgi:cyclic beta-1,2-glucan synthetase
LYLWIHRLPTLAPRSRLARFLRVPPAEPDDDAAGPIRGELLGAEHFAERARELARGQRIRADRGPRLSARLLARLQGTRRVLAAAHDRLVIANTLSIDVGPAGIWFLDNYYVVQEHIAEVRATLPRGYYSELPELLEGPLAGYPRVYEIAIAIISHTEARVDPENTERFIEAFQSIESLTVGELWAIPAMLRLGLIESVRRMALRTVQRLDELEEADRWAERMHGAGEAGADDLTTALGNFQANNPKLTPAFVSRFLRQVRAAAGAFPPLEWVDAWTRRQGLNAEDAVVASTQQLALTQLMMANSIMSLRAIGGRDWREFVERQSAMEHVLRTDPTDVYRTMTFATCDRYRHVVERIARRSGKTEVWVAQRAIELAERGIQRADDSARYGHVGYYLVDEGLPRLEATAEYQSQLGEELYRWVRYHPNLVFVGGVAVATVAALIAVIRLAGVGDSALWPIVIVFALIPANDIAVSFVNQLVTAFLPADVLPRLDFESHGIAADCRTAVVVPTLFDSEADVRETLAHLEVQFLANRDSQLQFAVLSDFTDAPSATMPGDDAIVEQALAGIRDLNARYALSTPIFHVLHRARQWNASEGVWMGWERKRGKLAQLNRLIQGGGTSAFESVSDGAGDLAGVRYVITLDADTVLPPESARMLVGTLAHPLNHAKYDEASGRVIRGYGILQPRVGVSLPSANRSGFASILSGVPGVDPYTNAVSDVYQDLYHEGSFTGKGVYDVDAFERATHARFPENTLLSHDLIEGNYARAGLVTDIVVYDDYPTRYLSWTRRKHRWMRGDWQLLPWLARKVPGPVGYEPNRLSLVSQWKIIDNMRRSVVEIAQLMFLVVGWVLLPGSPVRWTILVAGSIAAPWIISTLLTVLRPPRDKSWRSYYRVAFDDLAISAKQVALTFAFLPHQAWTAGDAIVRTLYRLNVSKQHLLEWQTAQRAERASAGDQNAISRSMRPAMVFMVIVASVATTTVLLRAARVSPDASTLLRTAWPTLFTIWLVTAGWLSSPRLARVLSVAMRRPKSLLTEGMRADAERYAALHWRFFERFATAETHWLTPDNFQEDPAPVVAMRTSPTNIGLQLLSTVSAHDLGLIDLADMTRRLRQVFASIDALPKHRGHLFNWYALQDLSVLEPAYISTVDSGNFAAHLVAFRQACLEYAVGEDASAELHDLAARADTLVQQMEFGFLFDATRKLFSIGYHVGTRTLDVSRYDLLASEARIASFMAIAGNQVPVEHWFVLGRTLTHTEGATALVSWTGTMFEYLMPVVVMRAFRSTVLSATYRAAVQRQMAYAAKRDVPWGISESAYNVRDREYTYQYRAFGIPDLALKRGMGRDLVIAPYASALAAMIDPARSMDNLRVLEAHGALGEYGFYDALDYTRPDPGKRFAIVANYMSHHVGMTLTAFANVLQDNRWQRRFHADALVRSVELLLHERIPRRLVLQDPQVTPPPAVRNMEVVEEPVAREFRSPNTAAPQVALLGYQPYTVMLTQSGSGYSRFNGLAVTRWKADATLENTGQFCYVQDLTRDRTWSVAHQPTCAVADAYLAVLSTDRVTFERSDGDIDTRTEIVAIPADAAEVRRVTVTNRGHEARDIQLTSYGEVVLAPPEADSAHPAFSNLFVETEWHAWATALTATRRPRLADEAPVFAVHVMARAPDQMGAVSYETDRAKFIGRGRSVRAPASLDHADALSGTTGAVLDPVFALRTTVRVEPAQSVSVAFTTLVAPTRERAFELADRYRDSRAAQRALELAWTSTQIELNELGISPGDAAVFQELAGHMFFAGDALSASREIKQQNRASQPVLWLLGISGDLPILQVTIEAVGGLPMLRQLFAAHRYWRRRGLIVDLVVINAQAHGYLEELTTRINEAMLSALDADSVEKSGGIFIRRQDAMAPESALMLAATARVTVLADERTLTQVVSDARDSTPIPVVPPPRHIKPTRPSATAPALPAGAGELLAFDNGFGGLDEFDDYHVRVVDGTLPPAPWSNVIANPEGGFQVSERGAGCAWAESSYFYRLTAWHNDPVSDSMTDVIYLQDATTGDLWSPTPAPVPNHDAYDIVHGAGFSTFSHRHGALSSTLTLGTPVEGAVKISLLTLTNHDTTPHTLRLTAYAEWTLGVRRDQTRHTVRTWYHADYTAIFAQNRYEQGLADRVAFLSVSEPVLAYTASRGEFLGRNGSLGDPLAFHTGTMSGVVGVGYDPCAALQSEITIAPGESRDIAVLLGSAATDDDATTLLASLRTADGASRALTDSRRAWANRLDVITVQTPDRAFDAMLNQWTLYQALSGRMWARMGLYQSSGAYGFRDQLQDVMAFVYAEPTVARAHILRAARRQFLEGDVQHWWHPHSGRGVRTRFSDDLVWLPYVVDQYVRITGDTSVLEEYVPFLKMRELEPDEHEVYDLPTVTDEQGTIYEHCRRALARACTFGAHGLPLIGTGDWNDGFSRVGAEGRGESVWLAWFLITTLRGFSAHADTRGDHDVSATFRTHANSYVVAVERDGWDGHWYRRAFYDDGTPLGSASSDDCRIDAIAQSWSVIANAGTLIRQEQAMFALDRQLVREDLRLIMLLTPPFDKGSHDPGYIKGYLPGVRENGAQYTHGALWAVLATAMRGDGDRAFALYQMINPLTHGDTAEHIATYKVEPYVVAADVYTAKGHGGRGGWTWYTGSASWMYRVGLEAILGFTRTGNILRMNPCVPEAWPLFRVEYRFGAALYVITVEQPHEVRRRGAAVLLDGKPLGSPDIPLVDDGARHEVRVFPMI